MSYKFGNSSLGRRTELKRTDSLKRTVLRSRPKRRVETPVEREARLAWKTPHQGFCSCGCERFSMHLERHHVCYEQHVRREGGDVWNIANSMLLHPTCHASHHSAMRRIKIEYVSRAALEFALELLGEARSADYFARFYDCTVTL